MVIATPSGGIKGGTWGLFPQSEALCPLPPHSEEKKKKNYQNQLYSANLWIFDLSESHFALSMPRHKKKKIWCRH